MNAPDPLNQLLEEVRASNWHPRATILVAHGLIELMINELITINCKNSKRIIKDTRTYPHSSRCLLLNEIGILHNNELSLLDGFRKLRNDFVHDVNFHPSIERLHKVKGDFPIPISESGTIDSNLVNLSLGVIAQIWGSNMEGLSEKFMVLVGS